VFFDCPVCGIFGCSKYDIDDYLEPRHSRTKQRARAALGHWLRTHPSRTTDTTYLGDTLVEDAVNGKLQLPTPAQVALNIIRYVGDRTFDSGEPLEEIGADFTPTVGALSRRAAVELVSELRDAGILKAEDANLIGHWNSMEVSLTLQGWERYQQEARGKETAHYGFVALKFNDPVLDPFLNSHIKPALKELGFELRDMRERARAGVIDNLLRIEIRDADFILADLTHDNPGSYWEAGYAEGLGKPVLYICERSKFDQVKSHFDTNHCTTVCWEADQPGAFAQDLVATLRRSLD
jgi:hypothetical protein